MASLAGYSSRSRGRALPAKQAAKAPQLPFNDYLDVR